MRMVMITFTKGAYPPFPRLDPMKSTGSLQSYQLAPAMTYGLIDIRIPTLSDHLVSVYFILFHLYDHCRWKHIMIKCES